MATAIDVLHTWGWYPESVASLSRLYISSWSTPQPHLQARPVRPDMPGAFNWAAVKIASLCHTCDSSTLHICVAPDAHTHDSSTLCTPIRPNTGPHTTAWVRMRIAHRLRSPMHH